MINPDKSCFDATNFGASVHPDGGTPGAIDSIFDDSADVTAPILNSLNVGRTMLVKGEQPDSNIFVKDGLHMNEHGYVRWTSMVKPLLKKLYVADNQ